jgi:hypothetical protein
MYVFHGVESVPSELLYHVWRDKHHTMLHSLQIFSVAAANLETELHFATDVTNTFNEQSDMHNKNVLAATDLETFKRMHRKVMVININKNITY